MRSQGLFYSIQDNIVRVRVKIDPLMALPQRLRFLDDDNYPVTIDCQYERVFRICKRCHRIGHTARHCVWDRDRLDYDLLALSSLAYQRASRPVAVEVPLSEFSWRQRQNSARTSTRISWRSDSDGGGFYLIDEHADYRFFRRRLPNVIMLDDSSSD